ncbi:Tfp pilus assembly protein PilO [Legionella lansingensis]|uniref:Tfp pilus assembly protein PilO n=1 Tax=Legionella lansingensis TaxID=45067 RepID=A0A0W0VXT2_9GAMM|nr:type 4a pilus biogenesis protein PilO [Legionella lansingensis]KTD24797.1 Tfp pilus assembly protein PilO [Legionella lansingensis]SNV48997.1 Tfp pilus assembly protein PilO [Legionella lansingensis]
MHLNTINLNNISQTSTFLRTAFIVFLTIFVTGIGYLVIIIPQGKEYQNLRNTELLLRVEFEHKQQLAATINNYRHRLSASEAQFAAMLKLLPSKETISPLMENIFKLAKENHLTVNLFAPRREIKHDFYMELPVDATIKGEYHQLAIFLSKINHLHYIITFDDIKITKLSKRESKSSSSNPLLMKIKFKIYRSRTE